MNASSIGAGKVTIEVIDNMKTKSQLFTTHLERLSTRAKALNLILVHCRSKVMTNKGINIIHERVKCFGPLSVTDFLPDNVWITTNDIPKLGATQNACGQMESVIVCSIKELIVNVEEKFLV